MGEAQTLDPMAVVHHERRLEHFPVGWNTLSKQSNQTALRRKSLQQKAAHAAKCSPTMSQQFCDYSGVEEYSALTAVQNDSGGLALKDESETEFDLAGSAERVDTRSNPNSVDVVPGVSGSVDLPRSSCQ